MESKIYGLFDKKLGRFMTPPLVVRDDAEAVATVERALPKNILPDVQVELIGSFDDATGVITPLSHDIVYVGAAHSEVANG